MSQRLAIALVLIGAICYGFHAALTKIGYAHGLQAGQINGLQFLTGTALLWGIAAWRGRHYPKPSPKSVFKLMAAGMLMGITSILYKASLQTIPASIAVVLLFQFVWMGVLYDWLFQRIKPNFMTLISLAVMIIGALCAADIFSGRQAEWSVSGLLCGLGAAFSYAGTLYASGRMETGVSLWMRGPIMLTGALVLVMLLNPPVFLTKEVTWNGFWPLGILLGILCIAVNGLNRTGKGYVNHG